MLKMRSVLHCAILLPSRCKQWGAWVSYVEPAVHRFPIKFSQRRVTHWLRHQYIGNLKAPACSPIAWLVLQYRPTWHVKLFHKVGQHLPIPGRPGLSSFYVVRFFLIDQNWPALDTSISMLLRIGMISPNIAKGTTDPRVEFIFPKSYRKFKRKSWSNFIFRFLTKHQLEISTKHQHFH